jgi:hypothetical protein
VGVVQRDLRRLQRQAGPCRPQRRHRIGELLEGLIVVELAIGPGSYFPMKKSSSAGSAA